jgi:hypothetical protein
MVQRLTIDGLSIETIPLAEVRCAFEKIQPDLETLKTKCKPNWISPDIYLSLQEELSTLYMLYEEDAYIGFIVVNTLRSISGEDTLFVWASYQKPEYNYLNAIFKFLEKVADDMKAVAIEFDSNRKGWEKIAPLHDFNLVTQTYRREL